MESFYNAFLIKILNKTCILFKQNATDDFLQQIYVSIKKLIKRVVVHFT